jgi:hypothetical protein
MKHSVLLFLLFILMCVALAAPSHAQSEDEGDTDIASVSEAIKYLVQRAPNRRLAKSKEARDSLAALIVEISREYNHSHWLITAMSFCESSFNKKAIGFARKEVGLLQVHGVALKRCKRKGFDMSTDRGQLQCGAWFLEERVTHCKTVKRGLTAYASGSCRARTARTARIVDRRFRLAAKLARGSYEQR